MATITTRTAKGSSLTTVEMDANLNNLNTDIGTRATSSDMSTALGLKANSSDMTTSLSLKANSSDMSTALGLKANSNSPSFSGPVTVTGNITASGNITAFSDETLKKDWMPLQDNFVDKLSKIKSGSFTRIDTLENQVGVSAQSLQTLIPQAVIGEELLSVAYGNAALVACIELAKEVLILRREITELRNK